ncbi:hypothetical protein ACFWDQ_36780 [Streptomyces sp. NPDC060053]|uniref:hypothetical protein n=1 Tax=Streptomyces sp. NPDC060053 TaxID=3347047 RepID=UPI00369EF802
MITVVAFAVGAIALSIKFEHRSAEEAFVSGEFAIAGFLIIVSGVGDLLCWMVNEQITFLAILLLLGCMITMAGSLIAYACLTGNEGTSFSTENQFWALGSFILASLGGTSAVYHAASR